MAGTANRWANDHEPELFHLAVLTKLRREPAGWGIDGTLDPMGRRGNDRSLV
ncbi:hypothetical protein AbraIFM66950_007482 [Aspergillus brasiliensis]|nr:hypothetical protein AbraIFM66950_007482 [Aspergillus brasiliensis]